MSPIPESVSPLKSNGDPVSAMCQQLSLGLSLLSKVDEHTAALVSTGPGVRIIPIYFLNHLLLLYLSLKLMENVQAIIVHRDVFWEKYYEIIEME